MDLFLNFFLRLLSRSLRDLFIVCKREDCLRETRKTKVKEKVSFFDQNLYKIKYNLK